MFIIFTTILYGSLQIFYLDNIYFGGLNLGHDLLPRWQHFSNECFEAMIQANRAIPLGRGCASQFGHNQVLCISIVRSLSICYEILIILLIILHQILREASSCYSFVKQNSITNAPSAFSPSPQVYPALPKPTAWEHSTTAAISNQEQCRQPNIDSLLPTIFQATPSIESDVLDFSAILRNKYHGQVFFFFCFSTISHYFLLLSKNLHFFQVDDQVLDELKLYNARCLDHIYKSYRSLAASIVNENANIALKLLETSISSSPTNRSEPVSDNSSNRRRRFQDLLSGTDSSTEGMFSFLLFFARCLTWNSYCVIIQ